MSEFKFPCPKCGQNILCDTSNANMQIVCPACQATLTVPPPPPPPPAAPGKLTINKTAHHKPAAAPTATPAGAAPQPAAWGTQKAAPKKKKFKLNPKVTSAIGSILALGIAGAIGWFAFGAPYYKAKAEKEAQAAADAKAAADAARAAAEEAAKPKPQWTLDLASAVIGDKPAAGKEHGVDFKVETVLFQNNFLTLRQDSGMSRQFLISIPLKQGETLPGKSFEVIATNIIPQPRVSLNWKVDQGQPPGAQSFIKGYAMKLDFGTATPDGAIPGKIFLAVPDTEQSWVAGTFEITVKKPAAGQPAAAPTPNGPPKRRRENS